MIRETPTGVDLSVRVIPRARRSEVSGIRGDALVARLAAPPVEGAANAALIELLAGRFGISPSCIRIVSGERSRDKRVAVSGMTRQQSWDRCVSPTDMLADQSLRELLAAFASSEPTPAGGSASALASALGVSLLMMAASLARSRTGSAEERVALSAAVRTLAPLQQELIACVDRDHAAYREVSAARRLSKAVPSAHVAADDPVLRALQGATDAPIEVIRWSALALQQAPAVAAHCHRAAVSDVRVAISLVRAGFSGARSSAEDNLARMADGAYVQAARAEIDRLASDAGDAADAADRLLLRPAEH